MKPTGYVVIEYCDDYEQILALNADERFPPGGILEWATGAKSMFPDRAAARAAISRTDHYRLAFGRKDLPEKKMCRIERIVSV